MALTSSSVSWPNRLGRRIARYSRSLQSVKFRGMSTQTGEFLQDGRRSFKGKPAEPMRWSHRHGHMHAAHEAHKARGGSLSAGLPGVAVLAHPERTWLAAGGGGADGNSDGQPAEAASGDRGTKHLSSGRLSVPGGSRVTPAGSEVSAEISADSVDNVF